VKDLEMSMFLIIKDTNNIQESKADLNLRFPKFVLR